MIWQPTSYAEGLRMAWDEDGDGVEHCLAQIEPFLPSSGTVVDIGCGVGRLTVPIAQRHPELMVVGFDTSLEMVRQAPEQSGVVYETGWADRWYAFAFSVVTFQHMSDEDMRWYLRRVAWCDGAGFVFQFVEGTEREPLSMQRSSKSVRDWCYSAGFERVDMWSDGRFGNWRWVHAR